MNYKSHNESFCPVLSIGSDEPISCQHNCEWFNPTAQMCDLSIIANLKLQDPDALDLLPNKNAEQ